MQVSDHSPADAPAHTGMGQTVAKVILFGEHSVVYGYPAIALPLAGLRMIARVEPADGPATLTCLGWSGPLRQAPARLASVVRAVDAALEHVGRPDARLHVTTVADFPPERGLGSSAAAAGAVIRAVLDAFDTPADAEDLFELTQAAERVAHGHPSGLDATATASTAPIRFEAGRTEPIAIDVPAWLVVADSGVHGSTRETVGHIRERHEIDPQGTDPLLADLGRIARDAETALRDGDAAAIGELMDAAHARLAALGVSDTHLDALVATARDAGALGAKLTGGGRGGCVIALAESRPAAERIAQALEGAGARRSWVHAPQAREAAA